MAIAKSIIKESDDWSKKINGLVNEFDKKTKRKILRRAARPLRKAARAYAPKRVKPPGANSRYSTAKLVKGLRAPKGKGKVVAQYYPGNLRKSIATITFRRTSDVFVGPRLRGKYDAYYAAMVYGSAAAFNKRVLRPALQATQSAVISIIEEQSRKKVLDYKRKKRL